MGRQKLPEDLKKEHWRRYMRDYMKAYRKRQKDLKMFSDVVDKYSAVPRSPDGEILRRKAGVRNGKD